MNGWASVATAALIAIGLAMLAQRERRMNASRPKSAPPIWLRSSLALAAVYAPFSWLVWFSDSMEYKRSLLSLWLVFPGVLPTQFALSLVSGSPRPEWLVAGLSAAVASTMVVAAVAMMRGGWRWCVLVALVVALATSGISYSTLQMARM